MIIIRRRLIFWLIKAYIKKWGKSIFLFFILGLVGFFLFRFVLRILPSTLPIIEKETIGMVGSFTIDTLPQNVLDNVSQGLTTVGQDGSIKPGLATSWKIDKNGRVYTFKLKRGINFSDGTRFTSKSINYGFSDVKVLKPDDYTIIFEIKDSYAPFLVTVSRPIFKKGFVGIGNYKVKSIDINNNFVTSIDLYSTTNERKVLRYQFFPTEDS
ncbi:MAG: ABC transporter substrate-binding protein, partial [Candidatus Pacearchaeota archaeon]